MGLTQDQDFPMIARNLAVMGLAVRRHYVVGDDAGELESVLKDALASSDVAIMIGGLGPTTDDLTREVASRATGRALRSRPRILARLIRKFKQRGLDFPPCGAQQALVLEGAEEIANRIGTAPGQFLECNGKWLFLLPGPPYELEPMLKHFVLPRLRRRPGIGRVKFITLRTFGLGESDVQEMMNGNFRDHPDFLAGIGYCSAPEGVDVRLKVEDGKTGKTRTARLVRRARKILTPWTYGVGEASLARIAAGLLIRNKKTLSVAESCTGGLVCRRLTAIAGISEVFKLGIIPYENRAKSSILGVPLRTLRRRGAVSGETARHMAVAARTRGRTSLGLSVTGIAGPAGSVRGKPVGLVWIGLAAQGMTKTRRYQFTGSREVIQMKASQAALDMLRREFMGMKGTDEIIPGA